MSNIKSYVTFLTIQYEMSVTLPQCQSLLGSRISLSTVVLNSRDRQGMYGMQHFRAPINKPHNSL